MGPWVGEVIRQRVKKQTTFSCNLRMSAIPRSVFIFLVWLLFSVLEYQVLYYTKPHVLTCLLNLILFALSIHTPKIPRQSFRYVTFGDEQTVHLTLSLKKGKCMVFKPRQVQDVRIVKFKEIFILVINIMIVQAVEILPFD